MGWRSGWAAVAMAAMFLVVALVPMAGSQAQAELAASPTPGVLVNSVTSGDQINPRVFATGDGNVYVVWEEVQSGLSRIFFSMSEDGGLSFSARMRVDHIDSGAKCLARTPIVVVNSTGVVFAAWSDNRTGTYQIYMSTYGGGMSFTSDVLVAGSTQWKNQTNPDMAIENDNLFLAWAEIQPSVNNYTHIRLTYSTNSGATFHSPITMSGAADIIQQYPSIAVRGSKVCVAWHDSRENPLFNIYASTSTTNGQSFGTAVKVSDSGNSVEHWYPTIEILPSGKFFIAWQERRSGSFDIVGTTSTTSDTAFAPSFVIDSSAADQSSPSSSVDSRGVVSLVFRSEVTSHHRIMYTRSNDAATFIPAVIVNTVDAEQTAPDICSVSDGTSYMVFQDDRLGNEDVFCSKVINERPTVNILQPASGSLKAKLFDVVGDCDDPDTSPILQVEVQLKEKGGDVVMPWTQANVLGGALWDITINSSQYANGDYEIRARSYDGALYSIEKSIDVTFDNGIQPFVDLTLTALDIVFYPPQPTAGEQVVISANVTNLGNADAFNVQLQFLNGGTSLGFSTMSRVAAGTTNNTVFAWTFSLPSTYTINVKADPNDLITESDELNNNASRQLIVDPPPVLRPDLEVSSANISYSPSIAHVGETLNVSAQVYNFGDIIATNVKVQFDIDSLFYAYRYISSVNPSESKAVYINWTPSTTGTHSIGVIVDPIPHQQDEDNLGNNQATKQLTVYPQDAFKADLEVVNSSVTILPVAPKMGENVTIGVIVNNQGDVAATDVTVSFYMDSLLISTKLIPSIDPGMAGDTNITWLAAIGTHTLRVVVDEADTIVEANESNNEVVRQFTVYQPQEVKPNLYVSSNNITLSPDPPEKGVVLDFEVTIWNLGNDSATNVEVLMYIDGVQLGNLMHINYLAPEDSVVLVGKWMTTAGEHTFEVVVDPENKTSEWSKADNTASLQVELPPDPILTDDVLLIILAVVSLSVLGIGIYSYMKARARKKGKK